MLIDKYVVNETKNQVERKSVTLIFYVFKTFQSEREIAVFHDMIIDC